MFLNGSLENFSVADVLQLLSFARQTGALNIVGEVGATLYMEDGYLYFAATDSDSPLEQVLAEGGIEDWVLEEAFKEARDENQVGEALVSKGVDRQHLSGLVSRAVADTLFELFRMTRTGTFDFRADDRHWIGPSQSFRVDDLIAEARAKVSDWAAV